MSNTAETLVKEAEAILEQNVLVPIILQKCAERGHTPKTEQELQVVLKVAGAVREKIASGQLAPVPASQLDADGKMNKAASLAIQNDPFAFGDEMQVDMDAVDPVVKEAAAVVTWDTLEKLAATNSATA